MRSQNDNELNHMTRDELKQNGEIKNKIKDIDDEAISYVDRTTKQPDKADNDLIVK